MSFVFYRQAVRTQSIWNVRNDAGRNKRHEKEQLSEKDDRSFLCKVD